MRYLPSHHINPPTSTEEHVTTKKTHKQAEVCSSIKSVICSLFVFFFQILNQVNKVCRVMDSVLLSSWLPSSWYEETAAPKGRQRDIKLWLSLLFDLTDSVSEMSRQGEINCRLCRPHILSIIHSCWIHFVVIFLVTCNPEALIKLFSNIVQYN